MLTACVDATRLYNGATELAEKVEWLKAECEKHVNAGQLTAPEIDSVLATLATKQAHVEELYSVVGSDP